MFLSLLYLSAVPAAGLPTIYRQSPSLRPQGRPWQSTHEVILDLPKQRLLLPIEDPDLFPRRMEVMYRQAGFLYGPSLLGNSSYFPTGLLGDVMAKQHQDQWYEDAMWLVDTVHEEEVAVLAAIQQV